MERRDYGNSRRGRGDGKRGLGGYGSNQARPEMGPKGIPRRIDPPPQHPPRDNLIITVDTVIPPMPGKQELIEKPYWETSYKKEYEVLKAELEKLSQEKV